MKRIIKWISGGNDCEKCPCAWEEWGPEDCDGGCYAGRDLFEGRCRIPILARWYIARRAMFQKDHEYDGFGKWYEDQLRKQDAVKGALFKRDRNLVLCWEYKDESGVTVYRPYDQEAVINEISYDIVGALDDDRMAHEPQRLGAKWKAIAKETIKSAVFSIRKVLTL